MQKSAVRVQEPLIVGFLWTNAKGNERWATINYERLSDFVTGAGAWDIPHKLVTWILFSLK